VKPGDSSPASTLRANSRAGDAVTSLASTMISHPEKVLFPDDGITKGELAAYYETVAPFMLPHVLDRPVTMERYPSGIGKPGFMHKSVSKGFPAWLQRAEVPKKGGVVHHPLITDVRALLWVANQNCITPHVATSRTSDLYTPDVCVFDLDPSVEDAVALRAAALLVRDVLEELGLPSWVKTSGSKGYHIVIPLDGSTAYEAVFAFAFDVGRLLVQRDPEHLTQEFLKVDRRDRIFVDTGRNGFGATFAAPYAVRPKPGAPVSAPCKWEEVERREAAPQAFTLRNIPGRLESVGDLWAGMADQGHSLRQPIDKLRALLGPDAPPALEAMQNRFGRRLGARRSS
jgi:bifunctional non-homologous end joining protein LigD